ncbi:unnamed protein product [Vitrella brassicaformis CCMP3155]|uniref:Uncharacterized protein n=1 Tax=Vitrella brassicaformis (strain CCMP3155) TaxID=1169540 RepID=A0A0G4GF04_VITBC|nr:unnamed protein product [Vitrella brassicaformis CCMP3155]|eukprot:CEM28108.1 unnamed protein product [Vitrella brassicaformis CCMP3155]
MAEKERKAANVQRSTLEDLMKDRDKPIKKAQKTADDRVRRVSQQVWGYLAGTLVTQLSSRSSRAVIRGHRRSEGHVAEEILGSDPKDIQSCLLFFASEDGKKLTGAEKVEANGKRAIPFSFPVCGLQQGPPRVPPPCAAQTVRLGVNDSL